MMAQRFSLAIMVGSMLALTAPAFAYDCSQKSTQAELDAFRASQPTVSGMCPNATQQIALMKKVIEILDRCPANDPNGTNRWQAEESIKASQNTLDTQCGN